MKTVCMIPVRLGSQRIPKKNLRLLDGKPLICHVLDKAIAAGCFDEIWINSADEIFKAFCKHPNVFFYKRDPELATDSATNDDFVKDFLANIKCDYLVQLNTTSPCITVDSIQGFTFDLMDQNLIALHGMCQKRIEAVFRNRTLNFNPTKDMPPSQDLDPVYLFSSGLMGWTVSKYKNTYGGGQDFGAYILKGYETIDIDTEDDWRLAELAVQAQRKRPASPVYYGEAEVETCVRAILNKDGVACVNLEDENLMFFDVKSDDLALASSWARRVINTENNSATLICQMPGEGNRLHYHPDWNEWWYIVKGEWTFTIEKLAAGIIPFNMSAMVPDSRFVDYTVHEGEIVFIPKGRWHKITAAGTGPAVRLAVSRDGVEHVYA